MEKTTILNYPGSKRRLLDFIYKNSKQYIDQNKIILDIFAGTGCVAEYFKNKGFKVATNDTEVYSMNISNTILNGFQYEVYDTDAFEHYFLTNKNNLLKYFNNSLFIEQKMILDTNRELIQFNSELIKIWNLPENFKLNDIPIKTIDDLNKNIFLIPFALFTLYYSGSYFGLKQSIEIDSIRYAIEKAPKSIQSTLLTCLYYAIKECSFSKDGHMAQPLNQEKNFKRLIKYRKKNVYEMFKKMLSELIFLKVNDSTTINRNEPFLKLLEDKSFMSEVGTIYADPPYTDMQYSRYFHLLTTISNYEYPDLTYKNGKITAGLYANNRFQSSISSKSRALYDLEHMIKFAADNKITLIFSYGFPIDIKNQATNRYTMNIDELIDKMKSYYENVKIFKEDFLHCNHRNNITKKVYEYLIIGVPTKKNESYVSKNIDKRAIDWKKLDKEISDIKATNKSPLYNTMLYWSQKPYNVTDFLINNLSEQGDIILDPFLGSGVTILEASNNFFNRKSIGVDINDMPIFLCKNSITIPSQNNIETLKKIKEKIFSHEDLYLTSCNLCGSKKAKIDKIIYDLEPQKKIKEFRYTCKCSKKILLKSPSENDIINFEKIYEIKEIENIPLISNSRIAVKEGEKIFDKFSSRSLHALDIIKTIIKKETDKNTQNILWYIFSSIIHKSKILDIKLSSQWPLWIPKKNCVERNIFDIFLNAIDKYIKSRAYIKNLYSNKFVSSFEQLCEGSSLIIQQGIQNIDCNTIPSNIVDLVITDPPYLSQIPYSEYMQLYRPFLENKINFLDEIVISNAKSRNKDYDNYFIMLKKAFDNISRMLKNFGIVCLYFHDSNLTVWRDLITVFSSCNLSFENSIHIDKKQKTLKKILDPKKTMSGETLLFFKKNGKPVAKNRTITQEDYNIIKEISLKIINTSKNKYASTSQLYDKGILKYIIEQGLLEDISKKYKDLTEIFNQVLKFDSELGVWRESI